MSYISAKIIKVSQIIQFLSHFTYSSLNASPGEFLNKVQYSLLGKVDTDPVMVRGAGAQGHKQGTGRTQALHISQVVNHVLVQFPGKQGTQGISNIVPIL